MTPDPLPEVTPGPTRALRVGPSASTRSGAPRLTVGGGSKFDLQSYVRDHPGVVDALAIAVITAVSTVVANSDQPEVGGTFTTPDAAATVVAAVLILARRRFAFTVLALALVALVWSMAADNELIALRATGLLALFTVASNNERHTAWAAGGAAALVLFIASLVVFDTPWSDGENLQMVAWVGMATAAGDAVRSRRAYLEAMEDRARRAEQGAEQEARSRVVEERLRIARELHDVVAHHIAVINVQAGVASQFLDERPSDAREALAVVRRSGRNVLDELSGILSVLRASDELASKEPLPSLDQIEDLIASFGEAGLSVEWRTKGARRTLPPALDLVGYRIVQESLTNVHKHGGDEASALLRVDYHDELLSIEVVNDRSGPGAVVVPGYGIVGMRERVAAVAGTLDVGPTEDGKFRVHASLPIPGGP